MFKIALIQNLSELRNYSYADLRRELYKMNFEVVDITRDNIDTLIPEIRRGVDCVLFASNSLSDTKIYEYVCREEFSSTFSEYLANDGAALIMHQHALRDKPNPFPFISENVDRLEKNYAGSNISLSKGDKFAEQYFVFPNKVLVDKISENCFDNPAVSGNYWMLLKSRTDEWAPILVDNLGNGVIQKSINNRVVFSSVLLDYQKHTDFLQNILVNLIIDNMSLAILESSQPDTLGFSYFLNSLENNKLYYKRYGNDSQSKADLIENIRLGIHSAILVNDKEGGELSEEMSEAINQYGVKLIQVKDQNYNKSDSFVVHSVDKSISLLFSKVELKIQEELARGAVSGSFMKTVEVLMKLKEFEMRGMTKGIYTKDSISHVLELVSPHMNEDGSYDKTFGATCKALWLFSTFLGKNDKLTKSSYTYIKNSKNIETVREKLEKFYTLAFFEKDPAVYLDKNCSQIIYDIIDNDFADITEYDFVTILKTALVINKEDMMMELFAFIKANTDIHGEFFNSYVTAIVSSYMIDMYEAISSERHKEKIRDLLFSIILYLRQVNTVNMSVDEVLQVICALYKFESVVSFPVSDLTELIFKTGSFPHDYHSFENQINNYQKSRLEMDDIINTSKAVQKENKILKIYKKGFFAVLSVVAVALYISIYLMIALADTGAPVFSTLFNKIIESWPSMFSLIIVPVVSFIFNKYLKKDDK